MNNQTKVGLFSLITVIIFIFGFYFLKGINIFTTKSKYYAEFDNIDGMYKSNPVTINGHKIGIVHGESFDIVTGKVMVEMIIDNGFVLYDSCLAQVVSTDLVGSKEIGIRYKISSVALKSGDTMGTLPPPPSISEVLGKVQQILNPLHDDISRTLGNLDKVLHNVNDALSKQDSASTIHKLNAALDNIHSITASLDATLKTGALDKTLGNLESITGNISKNNDGIKRILHNVADLTDTLKSANLAKTVENARLALTGIDTLLHNLNNGDGTVASLIKDKKVYNDLDSAVLSLHELLGDVKKNPFRYVNVSFWGGKKRDDKYMAKQAKKEQQKASQ